LRKRALRFTRSPGKKLFLTPWMGLSVNLSEPACQEILTQSGEIAFSSSFYVFSCRRCSGLKIKQADSLNLILVANSTFEGTFYLSEAPKLVDIPH